MVKLSDDFSIETFTSNSDYVTVFFMKCLLKNYIFELVLKIHLVKFI